MVKNGILAKFQGKIKHDKGKLCFQTIFRKSGRRQGPDHLQIIKIYATNLGYSLKWLPASPFGN